jgi:DNA-binding MarR family transcriptional regulator
MTHPDRPKSIAYRVKRLYVLASQFLDEALKPYGLGRSQWQAITRIRRAGSITQRELQSILQVEPATLSGLVDALVAKGWLERSENPADKRGKLLALAPDAMARLAEIPDPMCIVENKMLEGVSAEDRVVVERVLERMVENLERGRE